MKAVILGATKGMGRAVARVLVERGDSVFLLGRGSEELQASASDLEQRAKQTQSVGFYAECDLEQPEGFGAAFEAAERGLPGFDCVIVTAGVFATQAALEADLTFARRVLSVNYVSTVLFCEEARRRLLARGGGTLAVWSSVAGERGRKPIVIYGSAKAGLSAYLEGLDHKYHAEGLRVVCVKPGFVKTAASDGLPVPPFAGEPEAVAQDAVRAIDAGTPVLYTPRIWALIMLVIRLLPRFVMRRIGF
ncbi:MAG: SDR family NAD(P)-dependent oxidoreductase [Polyangiales bacterium]